MPVTNETDARCQIAVWSVIDRKATRAMPASSTVATTSRISFWGMRSATTPPSSAGSEHADRAGGRDDGELRRTAADPDDLPDQADDPDAGGERREDERHGQPTVGSCAGTA